MTLMQASTHTSPPGTRPLKLDPPKKGSKNFIFDRAVSKKRPPPDRLLTLPFGAIKKSGENSVFRFSGFRFLPIFRFCCFWFCSPPKNYPQNLCHSFGVAQKKGKTRVLTRKNKGFFACLVADFLGGGVFLCGVLMLVFLFMRLLGCKCVICLWCLIFPLFSFCFPLCFWGGGGYSSFYINHFNGPAPMTKNMIKPQKTPISEIFVFDVLLWGLHPHTFTWLA